jgi:hypothetical protein
MKYPLSNPAVSWWKMVFTLLVLTGIMNSLHAQSYENRLSHRSPIISYEFTTSSMWLAQKNTVPLFGMGLHNYWYIKDIGDNQKSLLGLDIPFRFVLLNEEEAASVDERLLNYQNQFTLALLLRWDRHLIGNKRKLGFFMGAGPEFRTSFKSDGYMFVPFVQQEFGFNWQFAGFEQDWMASNDLGIALSLPLRHEERQLSMMVGSVFVRFSL